MVKQAICTKAMVGGDPNLQYHLATDASMNDQGECLFHISGQPAVNQELPEHKIRAQWEVLSQDPEALMRVSDKFGDLRSEALEPVRLEFSLRRLQSKIRQRNRENAEITPTGNDRRRRAQESPKGSLSP